MKVNVTVREVKKAFKIVFMRGYTKISDSDEKAGNFTFPADLTEGEIVSCSLWQKMPDKTLRTEPITLPDENGNETNEFAYDVETILSIVKEVKSSGNSGLIVKAK